MFCKTYYYIQYNPDSKKAIPTNAKTDMYVEVVLDGDTFATHFAVTVYTYQYIQENSINANHVLAESGFLLVPTLEDEWMWEYLQQNPEKIAAIGNVV